MGSSSYVLYDSGMWLTLKEKSELQIQLEMLSKKGKSVKYVFKVLN